jgi:molybdate transport system substrate-binding protein
MPDTVTVVTTIAMQAVLDQLAPELKAANGYSIAMSFGPPSKAVALVLAGEAADIVMTTPEGIDELAAAGKVARGSSRVVCNMIMGVAVRAGAPKPDISTPEKFKQAILAAKSLIHANPASGSPSAAHFQKVARELGIADAIKDKTILRSAIVAHAVAAGEAEMAIQQMSELLLAPGVEIVGPFPPELQNVVPLSAAVLTNAAAPQAAEALIALLGTPRAKGIIEKAGLVPPP